MRSININTWIYWTEQGMNLSDFCSFGLEKEHMNQIRVKLDN